MRVRSSLLAIVCAMYGCASTEIGSGASALSGDVTGDGTVDVVDMQCTNLALTWQLAGGSREAIPACLDSAAAADHNCDGSTNVLDLMLMVQLVNGTSLSPEIDSDQNGTVDTCERLMEEAPSESTYGDVTNDGIANVVDLQCFIQVVPWLNGGGSKPACLGNDRAPFDLNCDLRVNVTDLMIEGRLVSGAGLTPELDEDQNGLADSCE